MSAPVDTSTPRVEQIIDLLQSGQRVGDTRYLVALLRAFAAERDTLLSVLAGAKAAREYQATRANEAEAERDAAQRQAAEAMASVARMREAADNMAEAMARIVQWAEAYPEDVFPPVDVKAARERLGDDALFSRLHAEWARHLTKGIGGIARAALDTTP